MKNNMQNINIIDSMYKAFEKGDIPIVLGLLDDKFARLGEEHEYFNLKEIELHSMYNDKVLATLRYDAKRKSNGALYDAQVAHLWTMKNGKVAAFQQYVDTKQLADAANK